ncbi:MAG: radical SAM protein [Desulfobacterales bacterium]
MINDESTHRPFIIPVFLPHAGCPHQCVFCNQTSITGVRRNMMSIEKVENHIHEFLKYKGRDRRPVQVAFYGGNFLGMEKEYIRRLLNVTAKFVKNEDVDTIRFSTRPDTIDHDRLDIIKDYPVSTIEIGAQSMDDHVLTTAKRGHFASDTQKAAALLKERHYILGIQMMVGLPGEDEASSLSTACRIRELRPDVISGTAVLAGPYHPAFGHLVHSEIFLDMAAAIIKAEGICRDTAVLKVHPRSISKMRGLKNQNVDILKKRFHIKSIKIIPDASVPEDRLALSDSICGKRLTF